jgi:hypothetical protein
MPASLGERAGNHEERRVLNLNRAEAREQSSAFASLGPVLAFPVLGTRKWVKRGADYVRQQVLRGRQPNAVSASKFV